MAYYYITFYSKRGLVILEKQVLFWWSSNFANAALINSLYYL